MTESVSRNLADSAESDRDTCPSKKNNDDLKRYMGGNDSEYVGNYFAVHTYSGKLAEVSETLF